MFLWLGNSYVYIVNCIFSWFIISTYFTSLVFNNKKKLYTHFNLLAKSWIYELMKPKLKKFGENAITLKNCQNKTSQNDTHIKFVWTNQKKFFSFFVSKVMSNLRRLPRRSNLIK